MLYQNPEVFLSLEELDLGDSTIVISCREYPVSTGSIDLMLVTDNADIVVIETKLIRNPESSRTVVAQVIEYVKNLVQLDSDDFMSRLQKINHSIIDDKSVGDGRFLSQLNDNISHGNISVLIVGDEINPNIIGMVASRDIVNRCGLEI